MSTAEQIFERAKILSPALQREALDFICFLTERQQSVHPETPEFTSELMVAFAEAKEDALKSVKTAT